MNGLVFMDNADDVDGEKLGDESDELIDSGVVIGDQVSVIRNLKAAGGNRRRAGVKISAPIVAVAFLFGGGEPSGPDPAIPPPSSGRR
jgi:hypothetical protein